MSFLPLLPLLQGLTLLVGLSAPPARRPAPVPPHPPPSSNPLETEAARLWAAAQAERARPEGAVELWRMNRLAGWLPTAAHEARLRAAAVDPQAAPLYRAMAHWLLRDRAERRMDTASVAAAGRALGLINAFSMRRGPAPQSSTDPLPADGFRPYPIGAGGGELWLEAFLRPSQETSATLVTRLQAPGGPAVLRIGFDDSATVWLNGDEVYRAEKEHPAFLDQAAIPVALRAGDNRLVVEVRQHGGAWRFVARLTDLRGDPLAGVSAHADAFGPIPEPADMPRPLPDAVESLYARLSAAESRTPPDAPALRALADYAQAAALPDGDRLLPRVAVESAWVADPGPRSLRAWLDLLPEAERAGVLATHTYARPLRAEDVYADLALRLDQAWAHFHGRRFLACRALLEALRREAPDFMPALRLEATLLEELELPHQAVALWVKAGAALGPPSARAHYRDALRAAGRADALHEALKAEVARGEATADELYQLASGLRARGDTAGALALLDRLAKARPELWGYLVEAVEIEAFEGRRDAARARLDRLLALAPDESTLLERLARMERAAGRDEESRALLDRALLIDPENEGLRRYRDAGTTRAPVLDPPLAHLVALPDPPDVPAHVLYQGTRVRVSPTGLALREVRRVVRVLSAEGARQFSVWELPYTPGTQRLEVRVAHLLRGSEAPRTPQRTDRDLSAPAWRLYYDLRAEVLTFPRVTPGDVIEVVWEVADVDPDPSFPGYFGDLIALQETVPRAISKVEFESSLALRTHVFDHGVFKPAASPVAGPAPTAPPAPPTPPAPPVPTAQGNSLRFEALNVPGVPPEDRGPGYTSQRAYVHVSTLDGWSDATRRYARLLAGRAAPDERLRAHARKLVGDAASPEEKVRRLYHAVASGVRYVGLELGTHSFRPESPQVTLSRAYGDCKDKAVLLIALLRAVDVDAEFALVRTTSQGEVADAPASFALFDHAMVFLPGLARFVDPTQDRNDPFVLPAPDQGAMALVMGLDVAPRRVPYAPPEASGESITLSLALAPDGSALGEAVFTTRGDAATAHRQRFEADATGANTLQQRLAERFPGARVEVPTLTGLRPPDDPFEARAKVALPPFSKGAGGLRLPRSGGPWKLVDAYAHAATRTLALHPGPGRTQRVLVELRIPSGSTSVLPADVRLDSGFGKFEATARQSGDSLRLESALTLRGEPIAAARYPEFRAWLEAADRALADTATVTLPRAKARP